MDKSDPSVHVRSLIDNRTSEAALQSLFQPRADLTYRLIDGIHLDGAQLHQSLLTGTLIRDCRFDRVDLSRCDLDGVKIERSAFTDCNFENVDLRSAVVSDATFSKCNFANAYQTDCRFERTLMHQTSFRGSVLTDSSFTSGQWDGCDITRASFVQNDFIDTRFRHLSLGDCTFLYIIFSDCRFDGVHMNVESLGWIFGLQVADLQQLDLIHLGEPLDKPCADDLVSQLIEEYDTRHWHIGSAILRLNFGWSAPLIAIRAYLAALRAFTTSQSLIKKEDVLFLRRVMETLAARKSLPLLSCFDALTAAEAMEIDLGAREEPCPRPCGPLREFAANVSLLLNELLESTVTDVAHLSLDRDDSPAILRLRFETQPSLELSDLMNTLADLSNLPLERRTIRIEQRYGSYEEALRTTLYTAGALQVLFYLINGMISQLTEMRARLNVMRRSRLPSAYVQRSLEPAARISSRSLEMLQKVYEYTKHAEWITDHQLRGLAAANLEVAELAVDESQVPRADEPLHN